jgi:hypothetical protein
MADMVAVPRPDGNARVHLITQLGSAYDIDDDSDGEPQPFVLVGSQLFGTQEAPFLDYECESYSCSYDFVGPTSTLRNAQSFLVQDIRWDVLKRRDTIRFAPSFDKISSLSAPEKGNATSADSTIYAISGFDLTKLDKTCLDPDLIQYCLKVTVGENTDVSKSIRVLSDNEAILSLRSDERGNAKSVRLAVCEPGHPEIVLALWDLSLPKSDDSSKTAITPSLAILYKGDSQTISLTREGVDFSTVKDVLFDGKPYFTPTPDGTTKGDSSKFDLLISTDITKTTGKKEFTVEFYDSKTKKTSKATFTIDVALR